MIVTSPTALDVRRVVDDVTGNKDKKKTQEKDLQNSLIFTRILSKLAPSVGPLQCTRSTYTNPSWGAQTLGVHRYNSMRVRNEEHSRMRSQITPINVQCPLLASSHERIED